MKTQPNPALKNTAIFVGNNAELRKKAIEYYEENGYVLYSPTNALNFHYIATMTCNTKVSDYPKQSIESNNQIITLPTEPKSEYPKMMSSDIIREIQIQTAYPESLSVHQALLQVWNECAQYYNHAKDIPTVTLTQSELIEAYEKTNNVKVIIK